jgi:hypothetical protein
MNTSASFRKKQNFQIVRAVTVSKFYPQYIPSDALLKPTSILVPNGYWYYVGHKENIVHEVRSPTEKV